MNPAMEVAGGGGWWRRAGVVAGARLAAYGLSFLRNVVLARVLAPADFGLAALLGLGVTVVESATRFSMGQQVVQASRGGEASFQATAHTLSAALGLAGAVVLGGLGGMVGGVIGGSRIGLWWALLAVVPLARGLEHLDVARWQREYRYSGLFICEFVPQVLVTLAAWPLALWLGDFRVIVWLMAARAGLALICSHAVAERPYRWGWERSELGGMWRFGWPVAVDSLVIVIGRQADQAVVGALGSLEDVAVYALAASVVAVPWFLSWQVGSSLMLPWLARAQYTPEVLAVRVRRCAMVAVAAGLVGTLPLMVAGGPLVAGLFGPQYSGAGGVMAWLAAGCALRFFRLVPAVASMAVSDNINELQASLWRCAGLPVMAAAAACGAGLAVIAATAVLGEVAAVAASLLRFHRRNPVPWRASAVPVVFGLVFVSLGLAASAWAHTAPPLGVLAVGGALTLFCAAVATLLSPDLRGWLRPGGRPTFW